MGVRPGSLQVRVGRGCWMLWGFLLDGFYVSCEVDFAKFGCWVLEKFVKWRYMGVCA